LRTESSASQKFADSVLAFRPRVAVFDCDGTLWSGDSGADFFYWQIDRGMFPHGVAERAAARYADYKQGKVDETVMCGEMVTINAGNSVQTLEEAAEEFFSSIVEKRIFPEMLRLTRELDSIGCEVWAVSSTNDWVVREGVKRFGIPGRRVLAANVTEVVKKQVDACFGNSIHDAAMLEVARHAFAVNPNPDLEGIAQEKGWQIYWPSGTRRH
jgi:phosphoserine phosphatase